jgi:hypothetical protein
MTRFLKTLTLYELRFMDYSSRFIKRLTTAIHNTAVTSKVTGIFRIKQSLGTNDIEDTNTVTTMHDLLAASLSSRIITLVLLYFYI